MRTLVFDSHDDETDVTAFWQILGVDADALLSVTFCEPMIFQQPTPCQLRSTFL